MSVTISTVKLVDLLTDALHTDSAELSQEVGLGIHIGTSRGGWGEEPGEVDVLTATSTTRFVMGHTWMPCDGQMPATVWPVDAARNVLAIVKSLAGKSGKGEPDITVDIMVATAPIVDGVTGDDEHPGWTITVRETPALFDSDTEFQFHAHPETRFPVAGTARLLGGEFTEDPKHNRGPLTVWDPSVLKPLVAVASRRKEPIRMYRYPRSAAHRIQIGESWLGAAMSATPDPQWPVDAPSIDAALGALVAQ
jgi:S-DNA-T family DNA segregation ATPase FtsK/SpoIIIE